MTYVSTSKPFYQFVLDEVFIFFQLQIGNKFLMPAIILKLAWKKVELTRGGEYPELRRTISMASNVSSSFRSQGFPGGIHL